MLFYKCRGSTRTAILVSGSDICVVNSMKLHLTSSGQLQKYWSLVQIGNYSLAQRLSTILYRGAQFFSIGFVASAAGHSLTKYGASFLSFFQLQSSTHWKLFPGRICTCCCHRLTSSFSLCYHFLLHSRIQKVATNYLQACSCQDVQYSVAFWEDFPPC